MATDFKKTYGPWAVVTGASDGIGRELAARLAERGLNVVLCARRASVLEELAGELTTKYAITARVVAADLGTHDGIAALTSCTDELDIGLLVAAAGFGTSGAFLELPVANELAMVDVNCRTVVELAHSYGLRIAARGCGGLVLMSSLLAFQGVPRASTYAASKAFVQSFAEGLRGELGPRGVDVLACAPGPIHSGFAARAAMTMSFAQTPADVAGATLAALGRRSTVRPGWLSKVLELSLAILPRRGRVRVMSLVMAKMTRAHPRLEAP